MDIPLALLHPVRGCTVRPAAEVCPPLPLASRLCRAQVACQCGAAGPCIHAMEQVTSADLSEVASQSGSLCTTLCNGFGRPDSIHRIAAGLRTTRADAASASAAAWLDDVVAPWVRRNCSFVGNTGSCARPAAPPGSAIAVATTSHTCRAMPDGSARCTMEYTIHRPYAG